MSRRTIYSFKSTHIMDRFMEEIMHERNLDRTSVIKLGLYLLVCYNERDTTKKLGLAEMVSDIESLATSRIPTYGEFGDS